MCYCTCESFGAFAAAGGVIVLVFVAGAILGHLLTKR